MTLGQPNSEGATGASGRDNLFWWTVFLLLLAGVGIGCWVGSFYVFGHPEKARPYEILTRLGKLAPPARFAVTKAPLGDFLGAQRVYEKYSKFTTVQLQHENEQLLRSYLRNYAESKRLVPYLVGNYIILKAYELQDSDLFPSGVVALAQAEEFPQLLVDLVYPTEKKDAPALLELLRPGLAVRLEKTLDLSAILHVGQERDGRLHVTTLSILYGQYALKGGVGRFSLDPPKRINVRAGFPLVRGEEVRSVLFDQLEQRRRRLASGGAQLPETPTAQHLVRVDSDLSLQGTALMASDALSSAATKAASLPTSELGTTDQAGSQKVQSSSGSGSSPEGEKVAPQGVTPSRGGGGASGSDGGMNATAIAAVGGTSAVQGKGKGGTKPSPEGALGKTVAAGTLGLSGVVPGARNGAVSLVSSGSLKGGMPGNGGSAAASKPDLGKGQSAPEAGVVSAIPVSALASQKGAVKPTQGGITSPASPAGGLPVLQGGPSAVGIANGAPVAAIPVLTPPGTTSMSTQKGAQQAQSGPGGGELRPVVSASPAPNAVPAPARWKTYGPGQQPGGRVISTQQATALADRNDTGRLYLRGQFVVRATDKNRALLREARVDEGSVAARVIVEYPQGAVPPATGSSVARDDGRGFEIREVRKGPDGQINIFVREVLAP